MTRAVQQVAFVDTEDGAVIEIDYIDTDNSRVDGQVLMLTHLQVSMKHRDYREDGERLLRAAERLMNNALNDFNASEPDRPAPPATADDEDEGMGMGYGDHS